MGKDIFISYSSKDRDWVKGWLMPRLEKAGLEVYIDFRDFEIGVPSLINMERGITDCRKTLLILTPNWVESQWTHLESFMLQTADPNGLKGTILPLMLEKCTLPPRLSIFTYADFKREDEREEQLRHLLKQLKPKEPTDTGTPVTVSLSTREDVFISYSHDSTEHAQRVLALANRLNRDGIECTIDQYDSAPPEGWPKWMAKHVEQSEFVLAICTETYCKRCSGKEKKGVGKGVKFESTLIFNDLYHNDSLNERFLPVLLDPADVKHIPSALQSYTHYCLDSLQGYEKLYRRLTGQPEVIKPYTGEKKDMPPQENVTMTFPGEAEAEKRPQEETQEAEPPQVAIARLPLTGEFLLGRERELAFLDRAWAEGASVATVVAMGGVGKTALVNRWLEGVKKDNYRGARRVWAWSFYSQGSAEGRQVSADIFMDEALREFGDPDPSVGSAWQRGVRLAQLVRKQKTLLLLDGMEPMQFPPGQQYGRLKDQSLQALLRELAFDNPGFCVITTRVEVKDLADKTGVRLLNLDRLEPPTGAQLLRLRGVTGPEQELQEVSKQVGGHALALNLLGTYLKVVHKGDVRCVGEAQILSEDVDDTGHAERVMEKYESYLSGTPELEILYLLGFFDRPADAEALAALSSPDPLPDTPTHFQTLTAAKWKKALARLQSLGLLSEAQETKPTPKESSPPTLLPSYLPTFSLNAHPIVREYFSRRLKANRPTAYTTGHRRLYEYYKELPEKEQPDTLREMEPLYIAISHGCAAGLHTKVWMDVYGSRISRGNEFYSTHKLGAFGSDLAALSSFFREPWKRPVEGLSEQVQAVVLNFSGFSLRALGRLREAAQPMEAGFEANKERKDWRNAAIAARNLSELWLCLGDVGRAGDLGRESVTLADRSGDENQMMVNRTTHADALHQAGDLDRAEGLFRDAEARQKKRQPGYTYLYSVHGFLYCDLLLGRGRSGEVRKRAEQTLAWMEADESAPILTVAIECLSLARALSQESRAPGIGSAQTARQYLDRAVEGLREAGDQEMIARGLLARAGFLRWAGDITGARRDLREAREIAERGEMKLYLADFHLESCRVEMGEKNIKEAKEHLQKAKALVEETGYHRRDGELDSLRGNQDFQD